MTELCDIAFNYGTDKCPQIKHHFTEFYHEMFGNKRNEIKKVVEIGIGDLETSKKIGASLYMWRDYFPSATIYGADINPSLLFDDVRIKTFLCDQTKENDLKNLIEFTGNDVDIFVDDGLHTTNSQILTCLTIMPLLLNPIYIIEDVGYQSKQSWVLRALREYDCESIVPVHRKFRDDNIIVVRKK